MKKHEVFGTTSALSRREEIKARLRSKGLSMSDIARSLELAPSTIHSVVSGRSYSKRVAELIASKLELQVEEIWPEKTSKKG
jgi:lambda repressor-like predicted transcriptional regulator